ncbi:uncharacterized protein LOC132652538 [Meriones unguiculatus]|uniref:uncharacterized protein LOC132652538 n=1 Tax=Meriones unguiculatus TaxID=10047 RepID=UPI00293F1124|nr:uncharacterized protein LOC132652538 [Meriones unguiculatus]
MRLQRKQNEDGRGKAAPGLSHTLPPSPAPRIDLLFIIWLRVTSRTPDGSKRPLARGPAAAGGRKPRLWAFPGVWSPPCCHTGDKAAESTRGSAQAAESLVPSCPGRSWWNRRPPPEGSRPYTLLFLSYTYTRRSLGRNERSVSVSAAFSRGSPRHVSSVRPNSCLWGSQGQRRNTPTTALHSPSVTPSRRLSSLPFPQPRPQLSAAPAPARANLPTQSLQTTGGCAGPGAMSAGKDRRGAAQRRPHQPSSAWPGSFCLQTPSPVTRNTPRSWKRAQRLREQAAPPEVLSSIPSNHVVAHNLYSEIWCPLLVSRCTCRKNAVYIINIKKYFSEEMFSLCISEELGRRKKKQVRFVGLRTWMEHDYMLTSS